MLRPTRRPQHRVPVRAGLRGVLAVGEFRVVWMSHALSAVGDRLALVAPTVLIYDRTGSPFLAAVAYRAGTVPYQFLAGLGDRLPRRAVMAGCDLAKAALTAVMALPRLHSRPTATARPVRPVWPSAAGRLRS